MPDPNFDPTLPQTQDTPQRSVSRELLIYVVLVVLLAAILLPTIPRDATRGRPPCLENMQLIGVALQNYQHVYGQFPPAYTVNERGLPLHSWRTLILPFLGEGTLYSKIDLNKSWDDPINDHAFRRMPEVYRCEDRSIEQGRTTYLAIVDSDTCMQAGTGRSVYDIEDGLSGTAMVFESNATHAVPWMSPRDSTIDLMFQTLARTGDEHEGGYYIMMCDSSVKWVSKSDASHRQIRAISTINGHEPFAY